MRKFIEIAFLFFVLCTARGAFAQGYAQLELPGHAERIIFEDLNADGRVDLYVHEGKACYIFYNLPEKGYGVKVADKTSRQADLVLTLPKKARLHLLDLNGDKLPDFVAVGNGQVCVFKNLGPKGFALQPDSVFKVKSEDLFVSLADVDGDGKADLSIFSNKNVRWHAGEGASFAADSKEIYQLTSPMLPEGLSYVPSDKPLLRRFAADLDGKAPADVLVPEKNGYLILMRDGGQTAIKKLTRFKTPRVPEVSIVGQSETGGVALSAPRVMQATISIPELCQIDVAENGAKVEKHWILADGRFGANLNILMADPEKQLAASDIKRFVEMLPLPQPLRLPDWHSWESDIDVDGDGTVDRVEYVNEYSSDGALQTTIVTLYRRNPETGEFFSRDKDGKPGITCNLKDSNFLSQPLLRDFNGDKHPDIFMLNSSFGLGDIDKILKTKLGEIDTFLHIYYYNPDKRAWEKDGSFTRKIHFSFKLKFLYFVVNEQGVDKYLNTFVNWEGNFGGDSEKDLIVRPNNNSLKVYFFKAVKDGGPFSDNPDLSFESLPDFIDYQFYDFNQDGLTDVLLKGTVTGPEGARESRILILSNGAK